MKIYVAIGSWEYEGYSEPMGVFSTREAAEKQIANGYQGYDETKVMEYELDEEKPWP